jgi:thiaminase (transcriptional activator TenA)
MPDAVMARYLIQDHRFLDSFLTLLGAVLASADTFAARLRFGRFIGMMSSEENTYFLRAFEALGVPEVRRGRSRYAADRRLQSDYAPGGGNAQLCCRAFGPRCGRVALSRLGLPRAEAAAGQLCARRVDHTAHDNPDFRGFVDFLRAELDRVGPAQADLCRDFFRRAVALELSFFEAAYAERS